jgi:iturin family lipopeptide synthetase A
MIMDEEKKSHFFKKMSPNSTSTNESVILPSEFPLTKRDIKTILDGMTVEFYLNEEQTRKLKTIASREKTNLFTLLLSVFYIFLSKLSQEEDIVVGIPIANGQHPDLKKMMGMFTHTLALRNYPDPKKTVKNFLREVKDQTLTDYPNSYRNREIYEKSDDGDPNKTISKCDMSFLCFEKGNRIQILLEYKEKLFRQETTKRFIRYFKRIILQITETQDQEIGSIDIMDKEEKEKILQYSMGKKDEGIEKISLLRLLELNVAKNPGKTALRGPEEKFPGAQITYLELNHRANRLANQMGEKGVLPNTIISLTGKVSIELITGIVGIVKIGGIYLPIDNALPIARKEYIFKDSQSIYLVTSNSTDNKELIRIQTTLPWIQVIHLGVGSVRIGSIQEPGILNKAYDGLYIIYTSGSTGNPKGVLLEHRTLLNLIYFQYHHTTIPFKRVLQFSSIGFDVSLQEIFSTLLAGGQLFLVSQEVKSHLRELFKMIRFNRIETLFLPTAWVRTLANLEKERGMIPMSVKHLVVAGEQMVVSKGFSKTLNEKEIQLHNHYGPSETHVVTTLTLGKGKSIPLQPPIGLPISNSQIYITDKGGSIIPQGVPGEIVISGFPVGRGYLNQPEMTHEKFHFSKKLDAKKKRVYRTGDMGKWNSEGQIEYLGRKDQQVKIRGYRVELKEIENSLGNYPGILETIVISRRDERGDNYLCAYIVTRASSRTFNEEDIKSFLIKDLPDYMIPQFIMTMEHIPLNQNGKIDISALPEPGLSMMEVGYTPPGNKTEVVILEIWAQILVEDKEKIGVDVDFFKAGGHSGKAIIMLSEISKRFDVDITLAEVSQVLTIRGLSTLLQVIKDSRFPEDEPGEDTETLII